MIISRGSIAQKAPCWLVPPLWSVMGTHGMTLLPFAQVRFNHSFIIFILLTVQNLGLVFGYLCLLVINRFHPNIHFFPVIKRELCLYSQSENIFCFLRHDILSEFRWIELFQMVPSRWRLLGRTGWTGPETPSSPAGALSLILQQSWPGLSRISSGTISLISCRSVQHIWRKNNFLGIFFFFKCRPSCSAPLPLS